MSVSIATLDDLAMIAAYASGVDDVDVLLAGQSAAQARAYTAQYSVPAEGYTAAEIAAHPLPVDATLAGACTAASMLSYNCTDNAGQEHRTPAELDAYAMLGRALLAEADLAGAVDAAVDRLRTRVYGDTVIIMATDPDAGTPAGAGILPVPPANDTTAAAAAPERPRFLGRDEAIERIRPALKRRSGKAWSVTGGRGTARGWITVNVPPKLRAEHGGMRDEAAAELAALLGIERVHFQGVSIAPKDRPWYVARAEGTATP